MSRSCHPIALINAGNVEGAVEDIFEVGQLYQTTNSRGLQWAAVTGIAIASATKPGATVDSVLGAILKGHPRFSMRGAATGQSAVVNEIERALELTKKCQDFHEMRVALDAVYNGKGMAYSTAYANEVVTKAVCVFAMCKGNTRQAMISGVNMGRDTDCLSATASGICGALTGASSIPAEWFQQVDFATTKMPVTNSRRTVKETADGMYEAYTARIRGMRAFAEEMDKA
jgi:ADP-ribosylglycohydrolase